MRIKASRRTNPGAVVGGSKGGKETKFFCVWGVIGKTHGLPRAPSSRELSAKLTEGAAERSAADEDKKPPDSPESKQLYS
jgi:hypothetical protein